MHMLQVDVIELLFHEKPKNPARRSSTIFSFTLANSCKQRNTSLKVIWVSATRPDRIPTRRTLRGSSARIPSSARKERDARRSSLRNEAISLPCVAGEHRHATDAPPFSTLRYVNALQRTIKGRGRERERERVQCTRPRVPRTPFPGGCAFVARISIVCNEVSVAFRTNLPAQNFSDSGVRGTPGLVFAPFPPPPPPQDRDTGDLLAETATYHR